jgi:hypothetical protein
VASTRTPHAHAPCPRPMPTPHAHAPCPRPMPTPHAPCPRPMRTPPMRMWLTCMRQGQTGFGCRRCAALRWAPFPAVQPGSRLLRTLCFAGPELSMIRAQLALGELQINDVDKLCRTVSLSAV